MSIGIVGIYFDFESVIGLSGWGIGNTSGDEDEVCLVLKTMGSGEYPMRSDERAGANETRTGVAHHSYCGVLGFGDLCPVENAADLAHSSTMSMRLIMSFVVK